MLRWDMGQGPTSEDCQCFGALQRRGIKEFSVNEELHLGSLDISEF